MKTGVEIIAEWRNEVHYFETVAYTGCGDIEEEIGKLLKPYASQIGVESKTATLAKAGALIAAEIDRLNNVKQE